MTRPPLRRGMTLTELLVVVGIIVLILGLAIPALSVWESRKLQDAVNQMAGLLHRAQTVAQTEKRVVGLFFYVDPESQAQYVWSIEPVVDGLSGSGSATATADRFVLRDAEPFKLPEPIRAVPISVIDESLAARQVHLYWTPEQLADENLRDAPDAGVLPSTPNNNPVTGEVGTQFHRNFFVILFDRQGNVLTNKRAFIVDSDAEIDDYPQPPVPAEYPGLRTRLIVQKSDLLLQPIQGLHYSIIDENGVPIRFWAADGLLIYNDASFKALPDPFFNPTAHRNFLRKTGQPLFIHPLTGRIIKGKPEEGITT